MRSRLAAATGVLLLASATAAFAQAAGVLPASTPPAPAQPGLGPSRFNLGDITGMSPDRFLLFKDSWSPDMGDALFGPPSLWRGASSPRPVLAALRSVGMSVQLGGEDGPEGRRTIVLTPLYRQWDELNGWEKFAVTLQYAGAAAAVGHFAGKLVH
jgi:hypothetical protein